MSAAIIDLAAYRKSRQPQKYIIAVENPEETLYYAGHGLFLPTKRLAAKYDSWGKPYHILAQYPQAKLVPAEI